MSDGTGPILETLTRHSSLCPETDAVVSRLIVRELKEPGLGKMPQCVRRKSSCIGGVEGFLAREGAVAGRQIRLGNISVVFPWDYVIGPPSVVGEEGCVNCYVVREAHLIRLVDVEHSKNSQLGQNS